MTPNHFHGEHALAAAEAKLLSEAPEAALRLLGQAEAGPLSPLERGQGHLLRGRIAFGSTRGREAPALLLDHGINSGGSVRTDSREVIVRACSTTRVDFATLTSPGESKAWHGQDRSSIYGGFHVYARRKPS